MLIYTCQNLPKIYQTISNFSPWSHNLSLQSDSHYYPLYQLTSIISITIYHYLYIVSTTMYNTIGHEPIVQNNKFISVILTSCSNFSIFCVSSLFYIKNKKTKVMDKSKQKTRKNCNKLVETLKVWIKIAMKILISLWTTYYLWCHNVWYTFNMYIYFHTHTFIYAIPMSNFIYNDFIIVASFVFYQILSSVCHTKQETLIKLKNTKFIDISGGDI